MALNPRRKSGKIVRCRQSDRLGVVVTAAARPIGNGEDIRSVRRYLSKINISGAAALTHVPGEIEARALKRPVAAMDALLNEYDFIKLLCDGLEMCSW